MSPVLLVMIRNVWIPALTVLAWLHAVVPADAQTYRVRAGDVLLIEVLEDPALNRSVLVAPDGRISVPLAGSINVVGQTVDGVRRSLTSNLSSGFTNPPNVFVSLERAAEPRSAPPKMISVFVMGEAAKPGLLSLPPGTSVLQAFAMMGGFTKFAADKRIQLRRTNPKDGQQSITVLNYRSIETGAGDGRMMLQDGDVVIVPQRRLFE